MLLKVLSCTDMMQFDNNWTGKIKGANWITQAHSDHGFQSPR